MRTQQCSRTDVLFLGRPNLCETVKNPRGPNAKPISWLRQSCPLSRAPARSANSGDAPKPPKSGFLNGSVTDTLRGASTQNAAFGSRSSVRGLLLAYFRAVFSGFGVFFGCFLRGRWGIRGACITYRCTLPFRMRISCPIRRNPRSPASSARLAGGDYPPFDGDASLRAGVFFCG